MKAKVLGLFLLLSIYSALPALALEDNGAQSALHLGHKIVMAISRTRFDEAWSEVKANSTIPPDRVDLFAREYDSHYVRTIMSFGNATGVELIAEDVLGKSMLRITYLIKYEVTGVAWFLYFYRVGDKWVLSEFNYDMNSSALFKSAVGSPDSSVNELVLAEWFRGVERRIEQLETTNLNSSPLTGLTDEQAAIPELVVLNQISTRITELEKLLTETRLKLALIEEENSQLYQSLDDTNLDRLRQEIARLKRVVAVLKNQHPYVDF